MSVIYPDLPSRPPLSGDTPLAAKQDPMHQKAVEAAVKFEGFFVAEMLKQMRRTADEISGDEGLFRDRSNRELLDMADQMMADAMASQRAFGVADILLRQIAPEAAAPVSGRKD